MLFNLSLSRRVGVVVFHSINKKGDLTLLFLTFWKLFFGLHLQWGTNDNDSIGEDDRRGPPIVQSQNRQRQPSRRRQPFHRQQPLLIVQMSTRCSPVDADTRLKTRNTPAVAEQEEWKSNQPKAVAFKWLYFPCVHSRKL